MAGTAAYCARTSLALALALALLLVSGCGWAGTEGGADPGTGAPADPAPTSLASEEGLKLVVIGGSIPANAPEDCPGCTGFADLYGQELERATGAAVEVLNFSVETDVTVQRLLDGLPSLAEYLVEADAVIVSVAHGSSELASDQPCGVPLTAAGFPRWDAVDAECAAAAAARSRPLYERLFQRVAATRAGQPTILLTMNRYNDWIGYRAAHLSADEEQRTKVVLDAWNSMVCEAAETHGFACADIYSAFNGTDGLRPSGRLLAKDYTHPSQQGNDLIARVLVDLGFDPLL